MRRDDIDFQIFLEIGHVLSNVQQLHTTGETSTPSTAINRPQHDVVLCVDCSAESSRDDDALQFASIDDERLAEQAEAARLVEKRQSRRVGIADMDHQCEFSNSGRRVAVRALREALPNVRVEDERISRRQRAESTRRPTVMYRHARRSWKGGRLPQGPRMRHDVRDRDRSGS